MKICLEVEVPNTEANTIADTLYEVAEEIASTGYNAGEPDRVVFGVEGRRSIAFTVLLTPYRG